MALPDPKTSPTTAPGGTGSTNLLYWPLVIAVEDCFVPQSAAMVVEAAREYREDTCALVWALAGMKASGEICRN